MGCCCCTRRGDFSRCIPIYIVGFVFLLAGIPPMIAGIAGTFPYADFVGYVGGVSTFFGVMFLFLWHMITIPALERKVKRWDEHVVDDDLDKGATKDEVADSRKTGKIPGFANLAFENESSLPGSGDISLAKPLRSYSSSSNQSSTSSRQTISASEARENANLNQNNSNSNQNNSVATVSGTSFVADRSVGDSDVTKRTFLQAESVDGAYENKAFVPEIATISGKSVSYQANRVT